ncbi:glutamate--tRNA ligase [Candidatus Collierbacteria bacterium]|nr:glutamate--tRNA ligase [Candidatus Collierbacteria bacterium]
MPQSLVRTRFAPSPTGFLHIGGLRTAAYAYALAKHSGGKFILRIEDTDKKREVEGGKESIYKILQQFNLNWDEGPIIGGPHSPYIQSERVKTGIYQKAAQKLLDEGHAFYCFCQIKTKEEIKTERSEYKIQFRDPCHYLSEEEVKQKLASGIKPAIRLKVPDREKISYSDFVLKKTTEWKTDVVDDAMLLKSDGFPTYHLAVVVDDNEMQITHALRGHDWMPSTPIHLLIYKFLKFPLPKIGHLTDILDPAGGKLSKRKGNVSCEQFINEGYLPEAILNFVILLGWAPKDNRELFTLDEFVTAFAENGFQKSNPLFDTNKLNWLNGQYIRQKTNEELLQLIKPFIKQPVDDFLLLKIIPLVKERISKLDQFNQFSKFFFEKPVPPEQTIIVKEYLQLAFEILEKTDWEKSAIESALVKEVDAKGWHRGDFFMALRLAITGQKVTPPLTESMIILGKPECLERIKNAAP